MPVAETNAISIVGISNDTGAASDDFLTSDTTLTVFGRIDNPLAEDEVLQVSTDGVNWVAVADVSGVNWSFDDPETHDEDFTYLLRIVASDSSVGAVASQEVRIDSSAPSATIALDANITADDIVNVVEAGTDILVAGTVGGDVVDGDIVP